VLTTKPAYGRNQMVLWRDALRRVR